MKIKKAVIAAAGFGTRVLPASKTVPKEMLNVVDRPAIHYIVEEILDGGIEEILIVLSRGKTVIEDYFDRSLELESALLEKNQKEKYDDILKISNMGKIYYVRQKVVDGLGGAILCAESFVEKEPFYVAYADDLIYSKKSVCRQLCSVYEEFNVGVLGVKEVSLKKIGRYSSVGLKKIRDRVFSVFDVVEKPKKDEILSKYSIFGRCILPYKIFSILKQIQKGKGLELQLTDAMKILIKQEGMVAVDYEGKHYDMGNKVGVLKANVEYALLNEEVREEFSTYLKELMKEYII